MPPMPPMMMGGMGGGPMPSFDQMGPGGQMPPPGMYGAPPPGGPGMGMGMLPPPPQGGMMPPTPQGMMLPPPPQMQPPMPPQMPPQMQGGMMPPPMQQPPAGFGQFDAAPPPAAAAAPPDPRRSAPPPAAVPPVEAGGPGWRGSIAKSGVPVCNIACVRGTPGALPPMLNCMARTDLNNLAAHLSQVPFHVIQLAPATATDVAPLQEFVNYLLERLRAGVAKAGDTTLFIVPPSEWAGRVLHVEPTANLLGVVVSTAVVPAAQPAPAAAQTSAFGKGLFSGQQPPQPQQPPQQQPGGYGGYAAPAAQAAPPSAEDLARIISMVSGQPPR